MNELEIVYNNKLKSRQEESRFTDPAFIYDKEEFTNFVKAFYNDRSYTEELGLVQMAKNLVQELLKRPDLLLAFIFFSRQEGDGKFVNFYTTVSQNTIRLTDVSIAKHAIQYLDTEIAIESLSKL